VDWTNLAQDMDTWRIFVHMVLYPREPLKVRTSLTSRGTAGFSKGPYSVDLFTCVFIHFFSCTSKSLSV
jgi:hypothetical protein